MECARCGRSEVGRIEFTAMAAGATFHYCRHCEYRWWVSGSSQLELSSVLEAAAVFARAT